MTSTSKVRIYDLARELKQESKRIIDDAQREGADVSVASNSVSKEIAEKIRNKYFPKQETGVQRSVRVIKRADRADEPHDEETTFTDAPGRDAIVTPSASTVSPAKSASQTASSFSRSSSVRLIKREQPVANSQPLQADDFVSEAAAPAPPQVMEETMFPGATSEVSAPEIALLENPASESARTVTRVEAPTEISSPAPRTIETPLPDAPAAKDAAPTSTAPVKPAVGFQPKKLVLTKSAFNSGVRPGERVNAPAPPPPSPRERMERSGGASTTEDSNNRRREGRGSSNTNGGSSTNGGGNRDRGRVLEQPRGTSGETSTPRTTYIPPADARRAKGRSGGGRRGASATASGNAFRRGGRDFDRGDFDTPAQALTLEQRIRQSIGNEADELKPARIVEGSTVKEFAEKLGLKPKDIVALLIQRGVFATINQPINDDVAVDLGKRFGYEVSFVPFEEMVTEEEFEDLIATDADDLELLRAPVVTIMGHVDHGKTSLLDAVRSANVVAGEAGGITQHIGAYSAYVPNPDNTEEKRRIVFLDTPGHEAFTMMRARGAKATDVVVLVVAADDGVMPQTVEAIEHSRAAGVPIIVAINKIDKPDANPDRVKQELSGHGLQPIEWGGETEMVMVSAKQKTNLDTLLETILLTTDILDLKASPTRLASGVVLEAKLDRGRGSVATVLVQQGTLRAGDPFIVGQVHGKVRAMFDDRGSIIEEAGPATPVEVLGLQGVPQAGDSFQVVADITRAQNISSHRQQVQRQTTLLQSTKRGIESLGEQEIKELLVILKADVQGSVEVLRATLEKLSTEKVKVKVIRSGVGAITESDVLLASATQASASNTAVVIIGFNVRPETRAAELAKHEHVDIRPHSIIYKVEEEIRAAMVGMLDAIEQEKVLGRALVQQVFRVPRAGVVAGCRVTSGVVRRNATARLVRDGVVVWEGGIASLRRLKDDVSEVREGFECGIGLNNFNDVKERDEIEIFTIEKVAATEL